MPEAVGSPYLVGAVYVTSGVALAQLVFCTLGVLSVAGEYGTGQIRSTLAAAPTRVPALAAKLLVTVLAVMASSLVAVLAAWAASAPWFEATGMSVDLTRGQDLRIVLGVPLYLGAVTALAFGIGAIVRSSAAGIAAVLANVNDLAAMGARPVALLDTVVGPEDVAREALRGMRWASRLYDVPVVGGHLTRTDGPPALSAFGIGRAGRVLSATHARPGQVLVLGCCLEGAMRSVPWLPWRERGGGGGAGSA